MRTIKYLFLLALSMTVMTSCFEESELNLNAEGNNVAGFENSSELFAAIADGEEYSFEILLKMVGPTMMDLTEDVTITFEADETSTAIEGVHYEYAQESVTLSKANNYLGRAGIIMITEGIETPLDASPILYLKTVADGDNVSGSGKALRITFNYACPSTLAGTYDVEVSYTAYDGTVTPLTWTEDIAETGIGQYRTTRVGHWTPAQLAPGTPGYSFTDLCDVLTIPEQYLADYWANIVTGTAEGAVKPDDGTFSTEYSICFGGNCRYYVCDYTPAK